MAIKTFEDYIEELVNSRFLILLILIISLLVLTPFLDGFVSTRILMDVFLTTIFIAIIYAIGSKRFQTTAM